MKGAKGVLVTVLCLWLAGGCQQVVAPRLAVAGTPPDFLLVVLGCLSICGTRVSGAATGFAAGVIQGAISGAHMGQYGVSRTIAGFLTGWLNALELEANATVAFFAVLLTTLVSQLLLMFMAPPSASRIFGFLLATMGSAVYNGVLAIPLFVLLKRILDPPTR